jgi:hypothetical protein
LNPDSDSLRKAALHQRTGEALAAIASTGVPKGIYRFATHEEMNRFDDEARARAVATNVRQRNYRGATRQ